MATSNDIQYCIPAGRTPATIIAVKTQTGKINSEGDELIEYEYKEKVEGFQEDGEVSVLARRGEIRAIKDGTVKKIHVGIGNVIDSEDTVLLEYKGCDHDTLYADMCTECGKTDVPVVRKTSRLNMTHDATNLTVSQNEAERLEEKTMKRLLDEGKLSLIVDLDQTLIHATVGATIDEWVNAQGELPRDIKMFPLPDAATPYYIKLRPHLEDFLKKISQLYELHIYTMGTRKYADAVANAIDPDGKYFGGRILSRDENSSMTKKSISRLFPCSKSMVVIIDDRADVWGSSPNLVNVHPYEYFVGAGDINAGNLPKQKPLVTSEPASKSSETKEPTSETVAEATSSVSPPSTESKTSTEEAKTENKEIPVPNKVKTAVLDDKDDELLRILEILENIHEQFYDARENYLQKSTRTIADVEWIMGKMRSQVLRTCNILFSGVIPQGNNPERAEIWNRALAFGAECSRELNDKVTHVVAAKAGTGKVTQARRKGNIWIVRPEWLYHSTGRWKRQEEKDYLLPDPRRPPPQQPQRQQRSTTPPMPPPGDMVDTLTATPSSLPATEPDTPMEETATPSADAAEDVRTDDEVTGVFSPEMREKMNSVDWSDVTKEVEDFVGSEMDETDLDSDTSNTPSDASTDGARSPLINLKRARVPKKSRLGTAVSYGQGDEDEDEDDSALLSAASGGNMERLDEDDDLNAILNESGSDSDDEGDDESDTGSLKRSQKRRRLDKGRGQSDEDEDDVDADDEVTMDYSKGQPSTSNGQESSNDEEDDDDAGDFDEEDFLQDLENELNDDDDNLGSES
ncbi:RNA polymerase II subunit A C-terminal domain phosphatase [Entomortierella parvispora]|uniref:RNA polymerase II subunit A C-terminal domain phosphatase n=1 Tax=Entomortierella parvispora TaxID=205924 RepID=A0A9P3LUP7_9FUNG|nr:RNA polymerase II subunit A C-terminal domain phosphatase [Entomortierella parvispora]